jgi:hypothetical protein
MLQIGTLAIENRVGGRKMDGSKRRAIEFLENEIKTYIALALYMSKEGFKERLQVGDKNVVIGSQYYQSKMREARALVNDLRKPAKKSL